MPWPFSDRRTTTHLRPDVDAPGLASSFLVWGIWGAVTAATFITVAHTPVSSLYAMDRAGVRGAAGRAVVLLGWPVALVAIPIAVLATNRLLSSAVGGRMRVVIVALTAISGALCGTILLPGVVDPKDVDFRAANIPGAVGVVIALAISVWAFLSTGAGSAPAWTHRDHRSLAVFAILVLAAIPWLLANLGFYAGDVPGLRDLFMSKQLRPEPGYPHLRAVHLGNHDGFDGLLLALSAVVLMTEATRVQRLQRALLAYLSLLLVYGLAVAASDWWLEQVEKRGWTTQGLPSVSRPSLSLSWALLLLATALVWSHERRRARRNATWALPTRLPDGDER